MERLLVDQRRIYNEWWSTRKIGYNSHSLCTKHLNQFEYCRKIMQTIDLLVKDWVLFKVGLLNRIYCSDNGMLRSFQSVMLLFIWALRWIEGSWIVYCKACLQWDNLAVRINIYNLDYPSKFLDIIIYKYVNSAHTKR